MKNFIRLTRSRGYVMLALTLMNPVSWADSHKVVEVKGAKATKRVMTSYSIDLKGCPISFTAYAGGKVFGGEQEANRSMATKEFPHVGSYFIEDMPKRFRRGLSFECVPQPAKDYCATFIDPLRSTTEEDRRLSNEVTYRSIHPKYFGMAVAGSMTAVTPPPTHVV